MISLFHLEISAFDFSKTSCHYSKLVLEPRHSQDRKTLERNLYNHKTMTKLLKVELKTEIPYSVIGNTESCGGLILDDCNQKSYEHKRSLLES